MKIIDVRSDTVTQPTEAMRRAMYECPVGDDVYRDDPTVNKLEEEAAKILGKEAALFCTSGTQSNQLGVMTWTGRGDEIIIGDNAHIANHEVGAVAVLSGASMRMLHFQDDIPDAGQIEAAIREKDIHCPPTALICLENALGNGRIVPLDVMREIYQVGKAYGIPIHMDGARCFNAALTLHVDIKELLKYVDSVSCCLSKGLCAPVGSVLAGNRTFIEKARKNRKMLGGGMRQAGVIAAPALIAIQEMPKRLTEDHKNAKKLAEGLAKIKGITCDAAASQINMVFFRIEDDREGEYSLYEYLKGKGILVNPGHQGAYRMVTHAGITEEDIDQILEAVEWFTNKLF